MAKTREPSTPLSELPLIQQIDVIIAKNGAVSQDVKDLLMFSVVKTLVVSVGEIQEAVNKIVECNEGNEKRIETLEHRNIVTWCMNHPTITIVIVSLIFFLLFSHYGAAILDLFGIKLP